jgi:hypothetical protein
LASTQDRTTEVLAAIAPGAKRADVVAPYAMSIFESLFCKPAQSTTDWERVNKAIIARWSISGLEHIKQLAWKRAEAAAKILTEPLQESRQ